MKNLTPEMIAKVSGGRCITGDDYVSKEVESITTDSREASCGCMFVAIKGERVDGNKFISGAYEDGALCCMSENEPEKVPEGAAYIVVDSCLQALKDIAEYYREVCGTKIIGITGSVGKTSTKEMIASVLSEKFNTLKTLGNFNNELGVPLTLFRLRPEHEVAIVEMGISDFGEMTRLSKIVKPDACVITNIGQCHLENLGDRDGVLKAKTEIFKYLKKDGKAYLNGDDDKLSSVSDVNGTRPYLFGFNKSNDIYADNIINHGLAGTELDAVTKDVTIHIKVPVPGKHMVSNALAAVAAGLDMGMTPDEIKNGISRFEPVGGHSSIYETDMFTIMDDCYNANPVSMKAGLDVLSDVSGRKVAIIGDMFELGSDEKEMHYDIGRYAALKNIDCIICIGELAKEYEKGANDAGKIKGVYYFADKDKAIIKLYEILQKSDSILVKASHGMHFEKIVDILKNM